MTRYFLALSFCALAGACSPAHRDPPSQTASGFRSYTTAPERTDHSVSRPWKERGAPRPLPTIHFYPDDLTSSLGDRPVEILVDNLGAPVGDTLLHQLAQTVRLRTLAGGRDVAMTVKVIDVAGDDHGPTGYKRRRPARLRIIPNSPLRDEWHVVSVGAVPAGFSVPLFRHRQTLPDGSPGVRFAVGSHPQPALVRVCEKEGGDTIVLVDWSEAMPTPSNPATVADLRDVSRGSTACVVDPNLSNFPTTASLRFVCQNLPAKGAKLRLALDKTMRSASGRAIETPVEPASGKVVADLDLDPMQPAGDGCRFVRPW